MAKIQNLFIQLLINSTLALASGATNLVTRSFSKSKTCNLQNQIDNGCAEIQTGVKSLLECTALCRANCIGVIRPNPETSSACYLQHPCATNLPSCNPGDSKVLFYTKKNSCQHGSMWDQQADTCKCVGGWVGQFCERLPKHCGELRVYGYPTGWPSGKIRVDLELDTYPTPVNVRCDVFDTFENTMVMASFGSLTNNKTWSQYYDGYFYDEDNFWIGLDKIKALNDAGLKTIFLNAAFMDETNEYNLFERGFTDFELGNALTGFSFTFSSSRTDGFGPKYNSLNYGDCLGPLQGGKFSTWDNDNDEVPTRNCAAEAGVGWWFKDCNMVCNPLGWNYYSRTGPEKMYNLKMAGIDYESQTYARSSEILMFFNHLV